MPSQQLAGRIICKIKGIISISHGTSKDGSIRNIFVERFDNSIMAFVPKAIEPIVGDMNPLIVFESDKEGVCFGWH
jgi:hypothetical protein